MTSKDPSTTREPELPPTWRPRNSEFETDIHIAALHSARVLITAPTDRVRSIVQAIAAHDHRGAVQEIISCDAADADDVIAVVDSQAGKKTRDGRAPILWIKDVHRFGAAQQADLLRLIRDIAQQPARMPRVIASSNVDLFDRVKSGSFNADLFYKLNSVHIVVGSGSGMPAKADRPHRPGPARP